MDFRGNARHTPSGEDVGAVAGVVDTSDGIIVADKLFDFLASPQVPQLERLIIGARRQHGAVG